MCLVYDARPGTKEVYAVFTYNPPAFDEGGGGVIAALFLRWKNLRDRFAEQKKLQFSRGIELQPGVLPEQLAGVVQNAVQRKGGQLPLPGQVAAEKIQAAGVERVQESGFVERNYIEV